jgi:hypothetical protein
MTEWGPAVAAELCRDVRFALAPRGISFSARTHGRPRNKLNKRKTDGEITDLLGKIQ